MVLVSAYEFGDGYNVLHKRVEHSGSAVLGEPCLNEPCEDPIQACCAVSSRIQCHSCHSMLAMMVDTQAA